MATADNGRLRIEARIDTDKLRSDAAESQGILHTIGRTAETEGNNIDAAFRKASLAVAGVFTAQKAMEFGRKIVDVRKEIEGFEISFRTLLGNKEKADALFSQIRDFAVKTPLQLKDLSSAAQTLLSFNIEEAEIMPMLRAIGDISMGDTQKLQSLTLAFAQMSSTGKLMGQDLLQMINAGFNPLSVISEKTGKSIGVLKDEMSKGAISAEMVKQAFIDATAEGGKFHGMLEQQSQGIAGSISNLQGAVDDMMNDLGTAMQDTLVKGVNFATTLVKHYETIGKCLLGLVVAYGSYKAALLALVAVEKLVAFAENIRLIMMFRKELGLLTAAQQAFNITALKNPYIIAGAALIGIITTIYQLTKGTNEWEKANEELNEKLAEQEQTLKDLDKERNVTQDMHDEAAKSIAGEIEKVESLQAAIKDETASIADRRRAIKELQAIVPGYQASLTDEGVLYVNNTNAVNDYIASLENLALAKALQSKRESLQAQKLAAELERREAVRKKKKAEAAAVQARKKAEQQRKASEEQQRQDQKFTNMVGGREGHMMAVADNVAARNRRNAIQEELDVAENTLKQRQQAVEIQDKIIANAVADLKELEDYQRENNIKPVQTEHSSYGGGKGGSGGGGNSAATEAERLRREAQERKKALDEYQATLAEQDKEAEFDLRQQRINLAEDSTQKELDQIKLNYDRMLHENEKRRQEMYDTLAEKKIVEYMGAHPKAEQSEVNEYAAKLTFTDADLTEEQRKQLEGYAAFAEEYLTESNKRTLANMLSDVLTYEEQRKKITEDYAKRREAMYDHDDKGNRTGLKSGVSDGNVAELDRQEQKALKELNSRRAAEQLEQLKGDINWDVIFGNVSNLTGKQLKLIKKQLQEFYNSPAFRMGATPEQLKTIADAMEKINEAERNNSGFFAGLSDALSRYDSAKLRFENAELDLDMAKQTGNKGIIAIMQKRYNEAQSNLLSAQGAVGDATDSVVTNFKTVSSALSSLSNEAGISLTQLGGTIETLINTFGNSGSKIGGIISAALSLLDAIGKQGLDGFVGKVLNGVSQGVGGVLDTVGGIFGIDGLGGLFNGDSRKEKRIESLQESIDSLTRSNTQLEWANSKLYSREKASNYGSQIDNLEAQKRLILQQMAEEEAKKDTNDDRIQEWRDQIEDIGRQIADLKEAAKDAIIGEDITTSIDNFATAMGDAWGRTADKAKAVKDYVRSMLRQMVVEAMKTDLTQPITQLREMMLGYMSDGIVSDVEQAEAQNFMSKVGKDISDRYKWADSILGGSASGQDGATKGGFATATQDSVDELGGRAAAIQICGEARRELLTNIRVDVAELKAQVAAGAEISAEMRGLMLIAASHLATIARNTEELYEMNERLGRIERNTRGL